MTQALSLPISFSFLQAAQPLSGNQFFSDLQPDVKEGIREVADVMLDCGAEAKRLSTYSLEGLYLHSALGCSGPELALKAGQRLDTFFAKGRVQGLSELISSARLLTAERVDGSSNGLPGVGPRIEFPFWFLKKYNIGYYTELFGDLRIWPSNVSPNPYHRRHCDSVYVIDLKTAIRMAMFTDDPKRVLEALLHLVRLADFRSACHWAEIFRADELLFNLGMLALAGFAQQISYGGTLDDVVASFQRIRDKALRKKADAILLDAAFLCSPSGPVGQTNPRWFLFSSLKTLLGTGEVLWRQEDDSRGHGIFVRRITDPKALKLLRYLIDEILREDLLLFRAEDPLLMGLAVLGDKEGLGKIGERILQGDIPNPIHGHPTRCLWYAARYFAAAGDAQGVRRCLSKLETDFPDIPEEDRDGIGEFLKNFIAAAKEGLLEAFGHFPDFHPAESFDAVADGTKDFPTRDAYLDLLWSSYQEGVRKAQAGASLMSDDQKEEIRRLGRRSMAIRAYAESIVLFLSILDRDGLMELGQGIVAKQANFDFALQTYLIVGHMDVLGKK